VFDRETRVIVTVYRYTRNERRRDRRYPLPVLTVEIGHREYRTADWSLGGLCIRGYRGVGRPGLQLPGVLRIPGLTGLIVFQFEVARIDDARGLLAVRFLDLSPGITDLLGRVAARQIATH
jgi:hypothetical protein